MADNVKRTVEIAVKVTGVDSTTKLTNLADSLAKIAQVVQTALPLINSFVDSISKIKAPPDLSKVVTALTDLSKIKKLPDLNNIAVGFEKLGKMSKAPNLSAFVAELKKFTELKVPNVNQMATGFKKLESSTLNIGDITTKLNRLYYSLNNYSKIKLPPLTSLVNGFKQLSELNVGGIADKVKKLSLALGELGKAGYLKNFTNFASDLRHISTALEKATKKIKETKDAAKELGVGFEIAGISLKTFGDKLKQYSQYRLIADSIMMMRDAFFSGIEAIVAYDQSLKDLEAITGATQDEVELMGETILDVASGTKFSASEIAEGMRTLGQAGLSASESIQAIQGVSDLATGTLTDMATTVDLVSTALRVFDIDARNTTRVVDVFANAVNRSKLTIDKLKTSMNYVGPIAKDAGVEFEEMATSMAALANSGLRASTIGTSLRNIFSVLLDPSTKLENAARKVGVSLTELDPRTRSLSSVLKSLGAVLTDAQLAFELFGKRGASAALVLTGSNSTYDELLSTISQSGAAARMASIQMEGLGVIIKNLKDRLGVLAIAIGKAGVSDALLFLAKTAKLVIVVLTELVDNPIARFIGKIGLMTAAIAAVTAVFARFAFVVSAVLLPVLGKLTVGLAGFVTKLGIARVGVISLMTVLNPLLLILGFLAIKFASVNFNDSNAKEAAKDASKLAKGYKDLSSTMEDYYLKVSQLEKGSEEYKQANLDLKEELKNVSSEFKDLSSEARDVANEIDPLTGMIDDQSDALDNYISKLKELRVQEVLRASSKSVQAMQESGGFIKTTMDGIGDSFSFLYDMVSDSPDLAEKWGVNEELAELIKKAQNGTATFQELSNAVSLFGSGEMTPQQKVLTEYVATLEEKTGDTLSTFKDLGIVITDLSTEQVEAIGEKANMSSIEVELLVSSFRKAQKLAGDSATGIVAQWRNNINRAGSVNATELIEQVKLAGQKLNEEQEANIRGLYELQAKSAKELTDLEDKKRADIQSSPEADRMKIIRQFELDRSSIEKQALVRIKKYADDEITQNAIKIQELANTRDKDLDDALVKYGDNYEDRYRLEQQIRDKYAAAAADIAHGSVDPKEILAQTKELVDDVTEQYSIMYKNIELQRIKANSPEADKQAAAERKNVATAESNATIGIIVAAQKKMRDEGIQTDNTHYRKLEAMRVDSAIKANKELLKGERNLQKKIAEIKKLALEEALAQETANSAQKINLLKREALEASKLGNSYEKAKAEQEINKKISEENIRLKKVELQSILDDEEASVADRIEAKQEIADAESEIYASSLADEKKVAKARLDIVSEGWRLSAEATAQYIEAVDEAYALGLMSTEAHAEALVLASDDMLGGLKVGLDEAMEDLRTDAEIMAEIGAGIPDLMADGLSSVFKGALDSAEAAKEAVRDWAVSTLDWIAQIILKQIVLNAISSFAGPTGTFSGFAEGGLVEPARAYAEGGEVAGSSPTKTSDNILAWLTAKEFVQPVKAVEHYGTNFMESIRRLTFPREIARGFGGASSFSIPKSNRLASGGMPSAAPATTFKGGDTNLKLINVVDGGLINDFMKTADGESSILNVIKRNGSTIRAIMGNS